jgi:hypothetical protein
MTGSSPLIASEFDDHAVLLEWIGLESGTDAASGRGYGLSPHRLAEIDLAAIGERTGAGADGAADQSTLDRSPDQSAADKSHARADPAAAEGAIRGAVAARAQREERQG